MLLVAAAAAWQIRATVWSTHSTDTGRSLIAQVRQRQVAAHHPGSSCVAPTAGAGAAAILEIPAIGLVAPVEQGTGNAQLDVAVGHDPHSPWPADRGNTVLEAHDVSYFVDLDRLRPGDVIRYETACTAYVYTVQQSQVVKQGSPVYDTTAPTMTLVTCWPTDALWFTPDRYLVRATQTAVQPISASTGAHPPSNGGTGGSPPTVPAPPALVATGLSLQRYSVPMGTMTVTGTPAPAFTESPGPLQAESAAVEAFIGGIRATTGDRPDWWRAIAPGVALPAPLVGADNPRYLSALDVTVTAEGAAATGVTLTTTVAVTGGAAPGRYQMTVTDTIAHRQLHITGWTLTPA